MLQAVKKRSLRSLFSSPSRGSARCRCTPPTAMNAGADTARRRLGRPPRIKVLIGTVAQRLREWTHQGRRRRRLARPRCGFATGISPSGSPARHVVTAVLQYSKVHCCIAVRIRQGSHSCVDVPGVETLLARDLATPSSPDRDVCRRQYLPRSTIGAAAPQVSER